MTQVPHKLSLAQFCDHIGVRPSYGHQLKREDRLVLDQDGKTVLVAESIARIAATRDPSKAGVAARHAAQRGSAAATGHQQLPAPAQDPAEPPEDEGPASGGDVPMYDFQNAKAKREHWAAEREHAAFRKEAGELIERSTHLAAFAALGAMVRARLEGWSALLPQQLAGLDEAGVRAVIAAQVELVLSEIADAAARQEGGPHAN